MGKFLSKKVNKMIIAKDSSIISAAVQLTQGKQNYNQLLENQYLANRLQFHPASRFGIQQGKKLTQALQSDTHPTTIQKTWAGELSGFPVNLLQKGSIDIDRVSDQLVSIFKDGASAPSAWYSGVGTSAGVIWENPKYPNVRLFENVLMTPVEGSLERVDGVDVYQSYEILYNVSKPTPLSAMQGYIRVQDIVSPMSVIDQSNGKPVPGYVARIKASDSQNGEFQDIGQLIGEWNDGSGCQYIYGPGIMSFAKNYAPKGTNSYYPYLKFTGFQYIGKYLDQVIDQKAEVTYVDNISGVLSGYNTIGAVSSAIKNISTSSEYIIKDGAFNDHKITLNRFNNLSKITIPNIAASGQITNSGAFNNSNGTITFTRKDGTTYSVTGLVKSADFSNKMDKVANHADEIVTLNGTAGNAKAGGAKLNLTSTLTDSTSLIPSQRVVSSFVDGKIDTIPSIISNASGYIIKDGSFANHTVTLNRYNSKSPVSIQGIAASGQITLSGQYNKTTHVATFTRKDTTKYAISGIAASGQILSSGTFNSSTGTLTLNAKESANSFNVTGFIKSGDISTASGYIISGGTFDFTNKQLKLKRFNGNNVDPIYLGSYLSAINPIGTGTLTIDNIRVYNNLINGEGDDEDHIISARQTSHAEGYGTKALGAYSHAEGIETNATMQATHAEGRYTSATADGAHAEGQDTFATGDNSHAEGAATRAEGTTSHAEGVGTIASYDYQHVAGTFNVPENKAYIIGGGSNYNNRKNIFTVGWNGDVQASGYISGAAIYANGINLSTAKMDKLPGAATHIVVVSGADGNAGDSGMTINKSGTLSNSQTVVPSQYVVSSAIKSVADKAIEVTGSNAITVTPNGTNRTIAVKLASSNPGLKIDSTGLSSDLKLSKVGSDLSGYAAIYQLQDSAGHRFGDQINIPKDQFLKDAVFIPHATAADVAAAGGVIALNDPCIKFTFEIKTKDASGKQTSTEKVIYVNMKDLVDIYTGVSGVYVDRNTNKISGVIDPESDKYFTIGDKGFKLSGITDTFNELSSHYLSAVNPSGTGTFTIDNINMGSGNIFTPYIDPDTVSSYVEYNIILGNNNDLLGTGATGYHVSKNNIILGNYNSSPESEIESYIVIGSNNNLNDDGTTPNKLVIGNNHLITNAICDTQIIAGNYSNYSTDYAQQYGLTDSLQEVIGNGTADNDRKNIFMRDWDGNTWQAGNFIASGNVVTSGDLYTYNMYMYNLTSSLVSSLEYATEAENAFYAPLKPVMVYNGQVDSLPPLNFIQHEMFNITLTAATSTTKVLMPINIPTGQGITCKIKVNSANVKLAYPDSSNILINGTGVYIVSFVNIDGTIDCLPTIQLS